MSKVPPGTHLVTYSKFGGAITDSLGNAIELGQVPSTAYNKVWVPGSLYPNYTLYPPTIYYGEPLHIVGNPVTVDFPTPLADILRPNMGVVHWAACTYCVGSRWTEQAWGTSGALFPDQPR
jgi:hypothetical protein